MSTGGGAAAGGTNGDPYGWGIVASFADPRLAISTQVWGTANRTHYLRGVGPASNLTKIAIEVAVQSGNIDVGTFANAGAGRAAVPAARRASTGSILCPAVGYVEIPVAVAWTVGDWFAMACDNTVASFRSIGNILTATLATWNGLSWLENAAFPIPANATPATGMSRPPLMIGVP